MATNKNPGPFLEYFYIPEARILRLANDKLVSLGLMPSSPGPVPIERYCDIRWGAPEDYIDLPPGVLGRAKFSETGLAVIEISRELSEDTTRIGNIRTRSTLAHEIGHGELHAEKYAEKIRHNNLQGDFFKVSGASLGQVEIACREDQIFRFNKDEWWEIQANKFMAAVLMPKHLLRQVFDVWSAQSKAKPAFWPVEVEVADAFNVSQRMAEIAVSSLREEILKENQQMQVAMPMH